MHTWQFSAAVVALVGVLGCGEPTGIPATPGAAGTYTLESVDGCAPGPAAAECFPRPSWVVEGTMVLRGDGTVTRTMRYHFPAPTGPVTVVGVGTFRLDGGAVEFALRENAGTAPSIWRSRAELTAEGLTLRYPHPADGEAVEVFRRP